MVVTLSDMLRNAARRWPDKPAYAYVSRTFTWAEVDRRVDALAAALQAHGVKPGQVVGSLTRDGPVMVELVFAAARIGAVRVGLNYRMAAGEIGTILRHCACSLVYVEDAYANLVLPYYTGTRMRRCGMVCMLIFSGVFGLVCALIGGLNSVCALVGATDGACELTVEWRS